MHIICSPNNYLGGCCWLLEVGQEVHGAGQAVAKVLLDAAPKRKRRLEEGAESPAEPQPSGGGGN
jgi:hypothetical protein